MNKYEVWVAGVGTVYSGNNYDQAIRKYCVAVKMSKEGLGYEAYKSVKLMHYNEIKEEYKGKDQ